MFTLNKNPVSIWFSTNTRHHLLAGSDSSKPKRFTKAAQINFPSELFDTIDINLKSTVFQETYWYQELSQRSPDVQGTLTRLRPYLPVPYLAELGLQPPLPGPVSITLKQMDAWGFDMIKLEQLKRCRPLIICTNGESSLWNKRAIEFQPYDMMSMKAQVSLLKWVARKTVEAYKYHEPANLIGLYKDLWMGETSQYNQVKVTEKHLFIDPFELGESRRLLK